MKFGVDMAGVTILSLLCVVYLTVFCVMGIQKYDLIFKGNSSMDPQNVSVTFGSDVTFVCPNSVNNRTTWYKSSIQQYAAYIEYDGRKCILKNEYYPSISLGRHNCTGGNYSITIHSIQYNDSGVWRCSYDRNLQEKQSIHVHVSAQQGTTHSTTAKPTTPTTTTPSPSTTTTVRITSQRPDRTITTVTESETSTFHNSTTPGIISGTQVNIGDSTTNELHPSASIGFLIPITGGVCGVVVLVVVVVIVVLKLRLKKDKQDESSAPTNNPQRWSRNDETEDDLVLAENPMYVSYDQEEKTESRSNPPDVSVYDKVPDVYTMVQKVFKPEIERSAHSNSEDNNTPEGLNDIYSLAKEPM